MVMTAADVCDVLALLRPHRFEVWLDGGWGVDALLGETTRPHRDLDLVILGEDAAAVQTVLEGAGFRRLPDGREWNFVMTDAAGHTVDLHCARMDDHGNARYGPHGQMWAAGELQGTGTVGRLHVRCVTAASQMRSHTGYPPDEDDWHDVRALQRRFGIDLPAQYRDVLEPDE